MVNSDLNVYRFVKTEYMPGNFVDSHRHAFFHFFYILDGNGNLKISNKNYEVNDDELYLVPPGVMHSIAAKEDCNFKTVEIKFIPSKNEIIQELLNLPPQIVDANHSIKYILNELIQEATQKEAFYTDIINIKFTEIILHIIRENLKSRNSAIKNNQENVWVSEHSYQQKNGIFDKTIDYINQNIHKKIEVCELASMAGFSEAYFCTLFKENFKMSPGQYISSLKLEKAKDLLKYSELNISQIATGLGFSSLHYFSRFFKNKEGISPHRFLLKMKNHIFLELISGINDEFKVKS